MRARLTNLADVCRRSGLRVVEHPGWRTRGAEMNAAAPTTVVAHHTATSRLAAGDLPTLGLLVQGRSDLSGPLCNLGLSRSGIVYVIAAGKANHAGPTFLTRQANSWSIGIEAEHPGVGAWPVEQYAAYVKLCRTLRDAYGVIPVEGHKEVAKPKNRKTDPNFDMNTFRADVAANNTTIGSLTDRVEYVPPGRVDPTPPALLTADGVWGARTCNAVEWYLGVVRNGALDVETSSALQKWAGQPQTGALLRPDMRAIQRKLGVEATGQWTTATVLAFQNFLNRRIVEAVAKPPEAPPSTALRVKGPFPLPAGHWYGPESSDNRNHSGYAAGDRQAVSQIQAEAGATVTGRYDQDTKTRVVAWQRMYGVTPTDGLVGAATWAAMLIN